MYRNAFLQIEPFDPERTVGMQQLGHHFGSFDDKLPEFLAEFLLLQGFDVFYV